MDAQQFWRNVQVGAPDECWPWLGALDDSGYGRRTTREDGVRRNERAHRIAYKLSGGLDAPEVLHTCDNRPCCNPVHLVGGTNAENMQDMATKGRTVANRKGILTARQAALICALRKSAPQKAIAGLFGVSVGYVKKLHQGRRRAAETRDMV